VALEKNCSNPYPVRKPIGADMSDFETSSDAIESLTPREKEKFGESGLEHQKKQKSLQKSNRLTKIIVEVREASQLQQFNHRSHKHILGITLISSMKNV